MVEQNEAFIVFGHINKELVTAALFNYKNSSAYYSVSASKRNLFDKPISHVLMWRAIEELKAKNIIYLELGEQYPNLTDEKITQKERDIANFKRGFGGHTQINLNISYNNCRV